ncbi:hypothetical protein TSAR_014803 [Trichomalopsis sarcophagae]|uniref:Uncharacterized protein n=1 Tax=Trichomalopsis sarcophagae TaxID=543379 RepID=A0A232FGR5_9HYME|nr:hypothetical protein TSAR_014803 [Trichomalopsis sarcophagae]
MRFTTTILAACLCVALVSSVPVPNEGFQSQALDRLMVVEADNDAALRSKRTIGLLRQLFPDVTKMIEDKVNMVIGEVFKIFGPVVIQSVLGGNKNGGGGLFGGGGAAGDSAKNSNSGTTVEAKNPFDDDDFKSFVDDDDFFGKPKEEDNGSKISLELPTIKSEESTTAESVSVTTPTPTTTDRPEETTLSEADSVTLNAIQV